MGLGDLRHPRRLLREARDRARANLQAHRALADLVAPPAWQFGTWGAGSTIVPPARVEHPECIHVGRNVLVHEHAWFALERRAGAPAPVLRIGDGSVLNRFVKIECAGSVTLGAGVLIADRVLISDIDPPPAATDEGPVPDPSAPPRPVAVGDRVFIGAGAVIKAGVTLGEHCYVGANSVVVRDVPPRTLVAGAPARAVRQWEAP
jgi:acetyltransferase-like isoleucine patch superfamily enzyme